jgi:hypothetical protein
VVQKLLEVRRFNYLDSAQNSCGDCMCAYMQGVGEEDSSGPCTATSLMIVF